MKQFEWARTSGDGTRLHLQSWEPGTVPRAAVALIHGFGEHSGRYGHVAAALNAAGYAVVTGDHRGHGKSAGLRGHTPSYGQLLDDVGGLVRVAAERFPGLPLFIYGHSMGGNLTLNYVLRRRPALDGVVVTSPWLRLAFEPPKIQVLLGRAMDRIYPALIQDTGLDTEGLSRDPAVGAAYVADPLVHSKISARMYTALYAAGPWALAHAAEFPLPLLLMHGGADPITSAEASREFAARAPGCTFKQWDGLRHEMHNEPEQAQVLAEIVGWLRAHTLVPA